jgi:hypothetical protein
MITIMQGASGMKTFVTKLTKTQFEERLHALSREYRLFSKGYADKDCFVARYSNGKLRLMYHVQSVGNTSGYHADMLYARIMERPDGKVTVSYRAGKPVVFTAAMIIWNMIAVPIFAYTLWDTLWNQYIDTLGIVITGFLSAVGIFLLLFRSKKSIQELEKRLHQICNM